MWLKHIWDGNGWLCTSEIVCLLLKSTVTNHVSFRVGVVTKAILSRTLATPLIRYMIIFRTKSCEKEYIDSHSGVASPLSLMWLKNIWDGNGWLCTPKIVCLLLKSTVTNHVSFRVGVTKVILSHTLATPLIRYMIISQIFQTKSCEKEYIDSLSGVASPLSLMWLWDGNGWLCTSKIVCPLPRIYCY